MELLTIITKTSSKMKTYLAPFFILGMAFSLRLENGKQSIHDIDIKKNETHHIDSFNEQKTHQDDSLEKDH